MKGFSFLMIKRSELIFLSFSTFSFVNILSEEIKLIWFIDCPGAVVLRANFKSIFKQNF